MSAIDTGDCLSPHLPTAPPPIPPPPPRDLRLSLKVPAGEMAGQTLNRKLRMEPEYLVEIPTPLPPPHLGAKE